MSEINKLWDTGIFESEYCTQVGATLHIELPTGEKFIWPMQYLYIRGEDGEVYSGFVPWPPDLLPHVPDAKQ